MGIEGNSNITVDYLLSAFSQYFFKLPCLTEIPCLVFFKFYSLLAFSCNLIGLLSHLIYPVHSLYIFLPSLLQKQRKMGKEDFFEVVSAPMRVHMLSCYKSYTHTQL